MRASIFSLLVVFGLGLSAQNQEIEAHYDELTIQWLEISQVLKGYEGLSSFCLDPEFREQASVVLHQIHHYDSLTLDFLMEPGVEAIIGHHEHKKAMNDITKLEEKYSFRSFISFLRESCVMRNDLEHNKKELTATSGMDSYDGQKYILETDLSKFLRHIDKRVVVIDEHIHRINPDRHSN